MRCAMRTTSGNCALSPPSITRDGPRTWRHCWWKSKRPWLQHLPPRCAWRFLHGWPLRRAIAPLVQAGFEATPVLWPPPRAHQKNAVVRNNRPRCACRSVCVTSQGERVEVVLSNLSPPYDNNPEGAGYPEGGKSNEKYPVGFARWRVPSDSVAFVGIFLLLVSRPKMFLRPSGMPWRGGHSSLPQTCSKGA